MLSQAQSVGVKSAKQLQKRQEQSSSPTGSFISLDTKQESRFAPAPPPRQYKEPPSASAIVNAATFDTSPGSSRNNSRSSRKTNYVPKQELDRVAADCIDR